MDNKMMNQNINWFCKSFKLKRPEFKEFIKIHSLVKDELELYSRLSVRQVMDICANYCKDDDFMFWMCYAWRLELFNNNLRITYISEDMDNDYKVEEDGLAYELLEN